MPADERAAVRRLAKELRDDLDEAFSNTDRAVAGENLRTVSPTKTTSR